MVVLAFVALTALPVLAGASLGRRHGVRSLLLAVSRRLLPVLTAALAAGLAAALGWFWPLGLLTPVALGGGAALLAARWTALPAPPPARVGRQTSPAGALLGAALGGLAAAAGWCFLVGVAPLAVAPRSAASAASGPGAALLALVDVAHRGFLRHLPVVGPASDEVAALLVVLRATPEQQQALAAGQGWQHLAELPAMQRALSDDEVLGEIERVRDGSLLALWRLQAHPRVVELAACSELQALCAELRPTALAAALAPAARRR